jgi:putative oxidoreductase
MPGYPTDLSTISLGLLLTRVVIGPLMTAHGAQKLFGWFGGPGLHTTGTFMSQLGFRPGRTLAAVASITEIASGILVAIGFLGPVGPALMLSVMIVAAVTVHWKNGLFAAQNGIELPLLYVAAAVGFAMTGFGQYSVDAWLGIAVGLPATGLVLAAGVGGAIANLTLRRPLGPATRT